MKTLLYLFVSVCSLVLNYINEIYISFKFLIIAFVGGFIDYIVYTKEKKENFNIKKMIIHFLVAGFSGYLTHLFCEYINLNESLTSFLIGISGYSGVRTLKFFEIFFRTFFEKFLTQEEKDKVEKELKEKEEQNEKDI